MKRNHLRVAFIVSALVLGLSMMLTAQQSSSTSQQTSATSDKPADKPAAKPEQAVAKAPEEGAQQAEAQPGAAGTDPQYEQKQGTKPTKAKATSPAPAEKTQVGCLTGPDADGTYTLTNPAGSKPIHLVSSEDLKAHVGHQVKVSGQWEEASATASTESKAEAKANRKWKADKVEMMSETCPTEKSQKK